MRLISTVRSLNVAIWCEIFQGWCEDCTMSIKKRWMFKQTIRAIFERNQESFYDMNAANLMHSTKLVYSGLLVTCDDTRAKLRYRPRSWPRPSIYFLLMDLEHSKFRMASGFRVEGLHLAASPVLKRHRLALIHHYTLLSYPALSRGTVKGIYLVDYCSILCNTS